MNAVLHQLILLVFANTILCISVANGNDYILRIDAVDTDVVAKPETELRESAVCSIEVYARPRLPFHGRVHIGEETISISGKLLVAENNQLIAQFRLEHSVDTGKWILDDDGKQKPVIHKSLVRTSVAIPVGTKVYIDGISMQDAKTRQARQIRHVVTLSKYKPRNDGGIHQNHRMHQRSDAR